jgi:hypothetical protein
MHSRCAVHHNLQKAHSCLLIYCLHATSINVIPASTSGPLTASRRQCATAINVAFTPVHAKRSLICVAPTPVCRRLATHPPLVLSRLCALLRQQRCLHRRNVWHMQSSLPLPVPFEVPENHEPALLFLGVPMRSPLRHRLLHQLSENHHQYG